MRKHESLTKSESLKIEKAIIDPGKVRISNILRYMKSKESPKKEEGKEEDMPQSLMGS
jgi:hypothetical protein